MQLKDLINVINIYNAKIIYDKPEKVAMKIMAGNSPLYFSPVDEKEQIIFKNMKDNHDFTSSTAAIHIIDLSIDELVNIFECDGTGIHEFTNTIIEPYCDGKIEKNIIYTTFLFLHEIGHWIQFEKMNKKVSVFIEKDYELEKDNFDKMSALSRQRQERIAKGSQCVLTAKEKRLLGQYMKEYRNIPKEKEADEFALSKMESSLKLYIDSGL